MTDLDEARRALNGLDPCECGDPLCRDEQRARDTFRALIAEVEQLRIQRDRVVTQLMANGCDCECDHSIKEHDENCERCFACCIESALTD